MYGMAVSVIMATAHADNTNPMRFGGIFVGTGVGFGKIFPSNAGVSSGDLSGISWNLNGGYQFNPYFALETGYYQFESIKILSAENGPVNNNVYGINLLATGIIPLKNKFNVFGKFGFMRLHLKTSSAGYGSMNYSDVNKIVPEFGLGGGYAINDNFALSLQGLMSLAAKNNVPATFATYLGANYLFTM